MVEDRDRVQLVIYGSQGEDFRTITSRKAAEDFMEGMSGPAEYIEIRGAVVHPDANELVMTFARETVRAAEYTVLKGV